METILMDFYSDTCVPCKNLMRDLEVLKDGYRNLDIKKINIEENYDLVEKYNIRSVPTLVVVKSDEIDGVYCGYRGRDHLKRFLDEKVC